MPLDNRQPVQPRKASPGANAWILYRKEVMPALRQLDEDAGLPPLPQSEYSKVLSRLWHSASEAQRAIYRERAKRMRDEEMAKSNLDLEVGAGAPGVQLPKNMPTDPAWYSDNLAMSLARSPVPSSMWTTPTEGNSSPAVPNASNSEPRLQMFVEEKAGSYFAEAHPSTWALDPTLSSTCFDPLYIQNPPCAGHDGYGFAVETQSVAQPHASHAYDLEEPPSTGAQYHGLSPDASFHAPLLSIDEAVGSSVSLASRPFPEHNATPAVHGWDTMIPSEQGDFFNASAYAQAAPGTPAQTQPSTPIGGELAPPFDLGLSNTNTGLLQSEPFALPEQLKEQASFFIPGTQYSSQPQELYGPDFFHTTASSAFPHSTPGPLLSLLMADDIETSLQWSPFDTQGTQYTLGSLPSLHCDGSSLEGVSPGDYDWSTYDAGSFTPPPDATQSYSSATDIWSNGERSAETFFDQSAESSSWEDPTDWTQRWSHA
ncbi:hypothetical protein GY45DRAFT_1376071 [Cubamyces sp. BRFM 1775]|nr:hypothetical protein GY45DRAFT_1376071 [Cubamyces sp. BRFM 1775]